MRCKRVSFLGLIINYLLRGTEVMSTIEEVTQQVADLHSAISRTNLALDVIRQKIDELSAGSVVSQEQLNALSQALESAKSEAGAVAVEAETAAAPVVEPTPEPVPDEPPVE